MSRNPLYPCIAQVTTRGTFRDVGYNVGLTFGDKIRSFVGAESQKPVLDFYESAPGREFYARNLKVCQAAYPQYVRELQGLAEGAGVPFEHVFMINVYEHALSLRKTSPAQKEGDGMGCTALFVVDKNHHQYILHNEDMWPECKEGYLLTAEIEEEGFERESFTSFCYPGYLPNWAFGFNGHGLTFCVNAIHPAEHLLPESPGIKFVLRSVLRARDLPEVVELAKNAPHGVGYSCVINVSTRGGQMTSIEVGPGKPQGVVNVYDVTPQGSQAQGPKHYYHFNVYKHLKIKERQDRSFISSQHRRVRTDSLPPPSDLQSALRIMADKGDPEWPVFRIPGPGIPDAMETVCTVGLDVTGRKMWLYQGREDLLQHRPLLTLPLP